MPHSDAADAGRPQLRLRWWTELLLVAALYGIYTAGRLMAKGSEAVAVEHGLQILRLEKALHLNAEHPLNRLFREQAWIGIPADYWYATLHYVLTPVILVWIFRRRKELYRTARSWLMASTLVGLIGFTLLPTCPPRLLDPQYGFVDGMALYADWGWWGTEASAPRGMGGITNQYAAMPSLHCGWALWCGVMLWAIARGRKGTSATLARIVAVVYPLGTTIVVMGTANHYFLDAVAGAATMGIGYLLARAVLRATDALRVRRTAAGAGVPVAAGSVAATPSAESPEAAHGTDVGDGCQTSAGERIPGQRRGQRHPAAAPADVTPVAGGTGEPEPAADAPVAATDDAPLDTAALDAHNGREERDGFDADSLTVGPGNFRGDDPAHAGTGEGAPAAAR